MCFSGGLLVPLFDPEQAHSLFYWVYPMKRLVYGVGLNDSAFPVKQSKAYRVWVDMMTRCYSVNFHERWPTYRGCSVDMQWHSLSRFSGWMDGQECVGMVLDKDILIPGNKIYGPDRCVFIDESLNLFLTDRAARRGNWPIGVSWNKGAGRFEARCGNPFAGKADRLGYFNAPEEAHNAWRKRKHELAIQYAEIQKDQRVADALRKRYAPV